MREEEEGGRRRRRKDEGGGARRCSKKNKNPTHQCWEKQPKAQIFGLQTRTPHRHSGDPHGAWHELSGPPASSGELSLPTVDSSSSRTVGKEPETTNPPNGHARQTGQASFLHPKGTLRLLTSFCLQKVLLMLILPMFSKTWFSNMFSFSRCYNLIYVRTSPPWSFRPSDLVRRFGRSIASGDPSSRLPARRCRRSKYSLAV